MDDDVVQEMNKNTNYVYEIYKQTLFVNLCLGLFRQKNTAETSELKLAAAITCRLDRAVGSFTLILNL